MLLRGVKMPDPVLDSADIDGTRNRSNKSGRSFGGVPLRENSGGRGNGRGGSINYGNPFAAHLNPNFDPNNMGRAPPPPHLAAQMGYQPPPPPTMQSSGSYWTGAGYNTGSQGWGYRGPPPPGNGGYNQQGYNNQGGHGGGRDSYRNGGRDSYRGEDSYRGGRNGYNGGRDQGYDRGRNQGYGYGGGRR